jgi:hypothetical protein
LTGSEPPVPYETAAPNAKRWTSAAFDYLVDEKLFASVRQTNGVQTAVVSGDCPRCGDDVNFTQVLDAVTGESLGPRLSFGLRGDERGAGYLELTASCWCTEPHEGRPGGVDDGCGINFRVVVVPDA